MAPLRSNSSPAIGSVCAPTALTDAGTFRTTGAAGAIGALPLLWKVMVVIGSGAAATPPTVLPLAVA